MDLIIRGRKYGLSPRLAIDVLELAAAVEKRGTGDELTNVLSMTRVVTDSLKATGRKLGRVRGLRYWRFLRGGGIQYLLKNLSSAEVIGAYVNVLEIEGMKKKELEDLVSS
jgi:hypothetical protein